VGDPARQLSDGLHPLRVAELLLELHTLAEVLDHRNHEPRPAAGV
jgi:hypothetical protein